MHITINVCSFALAVLILCKVTDEIYELKRQFLVFVLGDVWPKNGLETVSQNICQKLLQDKHYSQL